MTTTVRIRRLFFWLFYYKSLNVTAGAQSLIYKIDKMWEIKLQKNYITNLGNGGGAYGAYAEYILFVMFY